MHLIQEASPGGARHGGVIELDPTLRNTVESPRSRPLFGVITSLFDVNILIELPRVTASLPFSPPPFVPPYLPPTTHLALYLSSRTTINVSYLLESHPRSRKPIFSDVSAIHLDYFQRPKKDYSGYYGIGRKRGNELEGEGRGREGNRGRIGRRKTEMRRKHGRGDII